MGEAYLATSGLVSSGTTFAFDDGNHHLENVFHAVEAGGAYAYIVGLGMMALGVRARFRHNEQVEQTWQ